MGVTKKAGAIEERVGQSSGGKTSAGFAKYYNIRKKKQNRGRAFVEDDRKRTPHIVI